MELAEAGATVISVGDNPQGTPGQKYRQEQSEFDALAGKFMGYMREADGYLERDFGQGTDRASRRFWPRRSTPAISAANLGAAPNGLHFHRRTWNGGSRLLRQERIGRTLRRQNRTANRFCRRRADGPDDRPIGPARRSTRQSMPSDCSSNPGSTTFIKTYREPPQVAAWPYRTPAGEPTPIEGLWSVEFIAGGPELPPRFNTHRLASWTELAGPKAENFAGTARYTIRFTPDVDAKRYLLDLGQVADSARVELNGKPVATLIAPPYRVEIGPLLAENNVLTIDVTNVAANRIRDLDRRDVKWRIFKDINLVNINYKPFDASDWPVRPAGLLGPVTITPLED